MCYQRVYPKYSTAGFQWSSSIGMGDPQIPRYCDAFDTVRVLSRKPYERHHFQPPEREPDTLFILAMLSVMFASDCKWNMLFPLDTFLMVFSLFGIRLLAALACEQNLNCDISRYSLCMLDVHMIIHLSSASKVHFSIGWPPIREEAHCCSDLKWTAIIGQNRRLPHTNMPTSLRFAA